MVSEQDLLRQGKQTPGAAVARHPPETAGPLLVLQRSDCHSCHTRPLTTPRFCSDPSISTIAGTAHTPAGVVKAERRGAAELPLAADSKVEEQQQEDPPQQQEPKQQAQDGTGDGPVTGGNRRFALTKCGGSANYH